MLGVRNLCDQNTELIHNHEHPQVMSEKTLPGSSPEDAPKDKSSIARA